MDWPAIFLGRPVVTRTALTLVYEEALEIPLDCLRTALETNDVVFNVLGAQHTQSMSLDGFGFKGGDHVVAFDDVSVLLCDEGSHTLWRIGVFPDAQLLEPAKFYVGGADWVPSRVTVRGDFVAVLCLVEEDNTESASITFLTREGTYLGREFVRSGVPRGIAFVSDTVVAVCGERLALLPLPGEKSISQKMFRNFGGVTSECCLDLILLNDSLNDTLVFVSSLCHVVTLSLDEGLPLNVYSKTLAWRGITQIYDSRVAYTTKSGVTVLRLRNNQELRHIMMPRGDSLCLLRDRLVVLSNIEKALLIVR